MSLWCRRDSTFPSKSRAIIFRRLQIEHTARGETTHQRLFHGARIDTRPFGEEHGFCGAELIDDRADLVAGLRDLPRAIRADVHDVLCVTRQHWVGALERSLGSADHDRERARFSGSATARNRCVKHLDTASLKLPDDSLRTPWIDRAVIDH